MFNHFCLFLFDHDPVTDIFMCRYGSTDLWRAPAMVRIPFQMPRYV